MKYYMRSDSDEVDLIRSGTYNDSFNEMKTLMLKKKFVYDVV